MSTDPAGGAPSLPRPFPDADAIRGDRVDLERLDPARHGPELWRAIGDPGLWAGVPPGPFPDEAAFVDWLRLRIGQSGTVLHAIMDKSGGTARAAGLFLLLQVNAAMGVAELGLVYGPALSRRAGGTEAFLLQGRYLFETLGYRRLEWRCTPENKASMRAAARYGFTLEGVLRQTMWVKGGNWDTAVHAILDREWPAVAARLEAWLAPGNFAPDGTRIRPLADFLRQGPA
ncbi:GNAT family protein [Arenibaculum sp.]|uniref:GNAT family N-acetyltransferase n=1 Tax=Arenibaculum sp. TaxID=2865862 RepID=UPI002E15CB29|nr:GNAT family protein [Arenibaculum sp.]